MFGVTDRLLLDFKVNGETYPVSGSNLVKLTLHETATYMAPMAVIALEDRMNFLVELAPLTGTELFDIGVGDSEGRVTRHKFRLFKPRATRSGSDSHTVKLYLISEAAWGLFSPSKFEGYSSKSISDVVREIASDVSLEATSSSVEETNGTFNLLCPGWTYAQFLRWLADRARSLKHGTTGFLYFVDLDDTLNFYSADYAKNKDPTLNLVRKDPRHAEQYTEKDVHLRSYRLFENVWLMGGLGARGATGFYFDFAEGEFVESRVTIDGSVGVVETAVSPGFTDYDLQSVTATRHQGLADDVSMLKAHLHPRATLRSQGVASSAQQRTLNQASLEATILRATNSLVKMKVVIDGDLRIHPGMTVKLVVGSPHTSNVMNQVLSGVWVVEQVVHDLLPDFLTELLLFRSGVGGYDGVDLVTPPGGRV